MEPSQRSVASATSAARFYVAEQADREQEKIVFTILQATDFMELRCARFLKSGTS